MILLSNGLAICSNIIQKISSSNVIYNQVKFKDLAPIAYSNASRLCTFNINPNRT